VNKVVAGKAVRTDVEVGDTFGPQTEIASGLEEGDQVQVATAAPNSGDRTGTGGENVFPGGGGGFVPGGGGGFQGGNR
jgi:hypothetical protein